MLFKSTQCKVYIKEVPVCLKLITKAYRHIQIDTSISLDHVDNKTSHILSRLTEQNLHIAPAAAYDSHANEHDAKCVSGTRVELLDSISSWAKNNNSNFIFWLNGMAGTGKSTVARTVAQSFAKDRCLGASFFFRRGESDRGNASRFVATIAKDLMRSVPAMSSGLRTALDNNLELCYKSLAHQFEKLIIEPLSAKKRYVDPNRRLFIVLDALDECEQSEDIRVVLRLLIRLRNLKHMNIHVFVTSRPEASLRLGFAELDDGTYKDLILHNVPRKIIDRDIDIYLVHELAKIRESRYLPLDWPGTSNIQKLGEIVSPLFIVAATVCRFIGENTAVPDRRLNDILNYHLEGLTELDKIYRLVMNSLFQSQNPSEQERLSKDFRDIVGSIVVLKDPLSIRSLANLAERDEADISAQLNSLHSVLDVPNGKAEPIRILHTSFRDLITDPQKTKKDLFWVDEKEKHKRLALLSVKLLSTSRNLRRNICNILPNTKRHSINKEAVDSKLSPEVQYACRFWITHLVQSYDIIGEEWTSVSKFLRMHFLHWLEAMSLIGLSTSCFRMVDLLCKSIKVIMHHFLFH